MPAVRPTTQTQRRATSPSRFNLATNVLVVGIAAVAGAALLVALMIRTPLFAPAPAPALEPAAPMPLGSTPVITVTLPNIAPNELTSFVEDTHDAATTYPFLIEFRTAAGTVPSTEVLEQLDNQINPNIVGQTAAAYLGWASESSPFLLLTVFDERSMWGSLLRSEAELPKLLDNFEARGAMFSGRDDSYEGRDVRVLTNERNETILVYGFLDDRTVVITSSEASFRTLAANTSSSR
jgi:hypothetical protein